MIIKKETWKIESEFRDYIINLWLKGVISTRGLFVQINERKQMIKNAS